ncbi:MAG: type II secretion system GspH family protein, partial [Heliobacteriaceae bacterium]|jgi:type II secretory pathway pseudopilin PulG|nr:type II secretion system GspH family protein [Heliobacteriaceae bacterium]
LAEVLITLGIIGVVAALTLPALMQNYKKRVVETKLKKVYNVVNNAIARDVAEYGDYSEWFTNCRDSGGSYCSMDDAYAWVQQYFAPYIKTTKIEKYNKSTLDNPQGILLYFADGSILEVKTYLQDYAYYIDKKALDNPKRGINMFIFMFNPLRTDSGMSTYTQGKAFEPYAWNWNGTRAQLLSGVYNSCNASQGRIFCTKLIQYDGWKIPDDYPFKF